MRAWRPWARISLTPLGPGFTFDGQRAGVADVAEGDEELFEVNLAGAGEDLLAPIPSPAWRKRWHL